MGKENSTVWLPHLASDIVSDARGPELDAYVVALEGWRRGLTLKWHTKDSEKFPSMKTWFVDKPGKLFSLSSEDRTHYFFRTRGDKVTNEAVEIGMDKERTKQYLSKAGVPFPQGKQFKVDADIEEIVNYASQLGYPVVLKPTIGSFGRGVVTDIQDADKLRESIIDVRANYNYSDIIVEKHIYGQEYRLYVVDDQVVGAINRKPPYIIGDGINTIFNLIEMENEKREKNPRLVSCLIKIDQEIKNYIKAAGYSLDSIPEKGEQIVLRGRSNISIGGVPVDVLDELSDSVKSTAVNALRAIPGLPHGAVDLKVDENKTEEDFAVVLELNPTAQIGSLLFPWKGQARDIPKAIIDYYFPETINTYTEREKIYFDFVDVLEPLRTKSATVTTVSPAPIGQIYAKKYVVVGDVQRIDYHRGLRKQAFERNLSGFVNRLSNGNIEVVVAGTNPENVDEFREAILADPERSKVENIQVELWEGAVKIGFEVKADLKTQLEEMRLLKLDLEQLNRELKRVEQQYMEYRKSFSWRITYPFRKIADFVKYIFRL